MSNHEVTTFLDTLEHPLKAEVLKLRNCIKTDFPTLTEIIKWNAPSYQHNDIDFLTFNLSKPKEIRLIFHRGAKVKEALTKNFIEDESGLLHWADKDRAILTFKSMSEITEEHENLKAILQNWINQL